MLPPKRPPLGFAVAVLPNKPPVAGWFPNVLVPKPAFVAVQMKADKVLNAKINVLNTTTVAY